jgi:hypothetical protein
MSLAGGRGRLQGAIKELKVRWDKTRMSWDDTNSRALEEAVLDPLERKVVGAVIAMEKMMEICARARRDCG